MLKYKATDDDVRVEKEKVEQLEKKIELLTK